MTKIVYTPPDELYISGSISEIAKIRTKLLSLSDGTVNEIIVEAETDFDPSPYKKALNIIKGNVTGGPIKISVVNDVVIVEGSKESFDTFSSYFDFDVNDKSGSHRHHEYFEGDSYVLPNSVPMVIGINFNLYRVLTRMLRQVTKIFFRNSRNISNNSSNTAC